MLQNSFLQKVVLKDFDYNLLVFRLDLLHPTIQGNKYFKLLHNIEFALENQLQIITMGGPHSNHLHACALACEAEDIPCYGIIRGTNFAYLSPTLQKCQELGMKLIFCERFYFQVLRDEPSPQILTKVFSENQIELPKKFHFIPEGGSNELGVSGATEILEGLTEDFDYVFCPVGTGGTLAGILRFLENDKKVMGISSLKDEYLKEAVQALVKKDYKNWQINFDYHFGGYAKWNTELIQFINEFKEQTGIPLCPIYTGKMMFGIFDMIKKQAFPPKSTLLAIHTGGLQGREGFNQANGDLLR